MSFKTILLGLLMWTVVAVPVTAQDLQPVPPPPTAPTKSLKVELVISRYQRDKKIGSVPYTLSVAAGSLQNELARLRIGAQVPVPTMAPPKQVEGKPTSPSAFTYRDIGTSIDCQARALEEGRFHLQISIDQTLVLQADDSQPVSNAQAGVPVFRSFRTTNSAVLRDRESAQFAIATDSATGEIVRVDVTLTVMK